MTLPPELERPVTSTIPYYRVNSGWSDKRLESANNHHFSEDLGGIHTRRNSLVRLGAVQSHHGTRESTANNNAVKLPAINRKQLLLNSSLSLEDLAPQPRSTQLHLISNLSPEAQYSMLRSYEQLIREELLLLKLSQDSTAASVYHADDHDEFIDREIPSYLITPQKPYSADPDCDLFSVSSVSEADTIESRRMKVSHFMEIAVRILNLIESTRKMETRKSDPNYMK